MLPWAAAIGALGVGIAFALLHLHRATMPVGAVTIAIMAMWQDRAHFLEAIRGAWGDQWRSAWAAYGLVALLFGTRFLNAIGLLIGAAWLTRAAFRISN